jgi:hypothetical protein
MILSHKIHHYLPHYFPSAVVSARLLCVGVWGLGVSLCVCVIVHEYYCRHDCVVCTHSYLNKLNVEKSCAFKGCL